MVRKQRIRLFATVSALAVSASAAVMILTAMPAQAVMCPTVNPSTGVVTPAPTPGVDWDGCDLSNAFLPAAEMANASLQNANLTSADLANADLSGANLTGATMTHVTGGGNFSGANLMSANLFGALMGGSNLRSANLGNASAIGTDFAGAALEGANLQGLDLDNAELQSADLFGATGMVGSDAGALWTNAICPNGASANYYTAGCFSAIAVTTPSATPTITSGTVGKNSWYISGVTVSWYWVDSQSLDPLKCPDTTTDAQQGSSVVISGSCTDTAGHIGTSSVTVPIDTTPPVVHLTGVRNGATYMLGKVPLPACTTADSLSGVGLHAATVIAGGNPDGSGVVMVTCTGGQDQAGNVAPDLNAHYTVVYEFGGFLAPKVGASLPATNKTISVRFRLTNDTGTPISANAAAALASKHDVRATLRGPGISPVVATCRWHSTGAYLGCPIPMPHHVQTGRSLTYTITATENLGTGFVIAPPDAASENPEPIHFK